MSGVLVIGRTGQLARALAEALPEGTAFLGRETVDLERPGTIAPAIAAHAPRLVVNAAAWTAVDAAEAEPDRAMAANATAVAVIAQAAQAAGAALVHVSTDYVYPGTGTRAHVETDPTGPVNAYGRSKLAGERAARAACPRTAILRTSWVHAPWGRNFLRTMLGLAGREELAIVADQHGAPTSALALADAIAAIAPRLAAAPAEAPVWGVFHCAGAGETTWAGFARAIFAGAQARGLTGRAPRVRGIATADYPTPARRPLNSRLCCARFETVFGLAMTPWERALDRVLDRLASDPGGG